MKTTAGRVGQPQPLPTRHAGPGESPGFLLWKVSNAWQRRQRAALQPLGLTHSQFVLLATATWFGRTETLTQVRLAELTGVDVMTTSQVLRTLEAAKLIERDAHPDDPRAKTIAVTARGRELARRAIVVVEATDEAFFAPVAARLGEVVRAFTELAAAAAGATAPPARPPPRRRGRGP
jgi:MarR family transcriptional regulator, organic hydroperoxide resistance regulator